MKEIKTYDFFYTQNTKGSENESSRDAMFYSREHVHIHVHTTLQNR